MRSTVHLSDPPLVPTPDEGRSLLRRELLDADYHRTDLLGRLIDVLRRAIVEVVSAASSSPPASVFFALALALALVIALLLLINRAQRSRGAGSESAAVLDDDSVTWQEWRDRAETAYAADDFDQTVVYAFRALTVRQAERGDITATPGTTAREVSVALAVVDPRSEDELRLAASTFDLVMYGDRTATQDQARRLLDLDHHWQVNA